VAEQRDLDWEEGEAGMRRRGPSWGLVEKIKVLLIFI
jgi:hypothetical protein